MAPSGYLWYNALNKFSQEPRFFSISPDDPNEAETSFPLYQGCQTQFLEGPLYSWYYHSRCSTLFHTYLRKVQ